MGGGYYDREVESVQASAPAARRVVDQSTTFDNRFPPQPFSLKADATLGAVSKMHSELDPHKDIKTDSKSPIVICCDVTGSMGSWPKVIWDKLPMMVGQIMLNGYVDDMSICFTACGDAYGDEAPLQVTEFATGSTLDDWISKLFLEGGGGGGAGSKANHETYELAAHYFTTKCTMTDADTPMFFFIGDETFYPTIEAKVANQVMGSNDVTEDMPSLVAFEALKKAFKGNVFLIHRAHPSVDAMVVNKWKKALGANRVLPLDNPKAGVDCMLGVMAIMGGNCDLDTYVDQMEDRGQDQERIDEVRAALEVLADEPNVEDEADEDDRKVVGCIDITTMSGETHTLNVVEDMSIFDLNMKIEQEIGLACDKQYFPSLVGDDLPEPVPSSLPLMAKIADLDSSMRVIRFDLQWGYPDEGKDYLDGSCMIFNEGKHQATVDFSHKTWKGGAIAHTGDVMDDRKNIGHHLITVDLNKLEATGNAPAPERNCPVCTFICSATARRCDICGSQLPPVDTTSGPAEELKGDKFIFVMSACRRPTIAAFKKPAVRLLDSSNNELGTYEIAQAKTHQAVIMCCLEKNRDDGWMITEWGVNSHGNIRSYHEIVSTIGNHL